MSLRAVRLEKFYGHGPTRVDAVRSVSLEVAAGECVALMGPSGSGKSTLLHLLAGLDRPSAGEVYVGGTEITGLSERALELLRRDRVGFVFQSFNLLPGLSALENTSLPLTLAGVPIDEADERAAAMLASLGLGARVHHLPEALSGGEQQRVAVARALVGGPCVVFADEPTGSLDSRAGAQVLDALIGAARERSAALLMVTHDPVVAERADKVLRYRDGQVVACHVRGAPAASAESACDAP
jgi:putative ABC transport system ATP-binding protein